MTDGNLQDWYTLELLGVLLEGCSQKQVPYGKYDGEHAVVDIKELEPARRDKSHLEPRDEILKHIGQLAVLLNRRHLARACLLPWQGFFRLPGRCAMALVFQFPSWCFSSLTPLSVITSQHHARSNQNERGALSRGQATPRPHTHRRPLPVSRHRLGPQVIPE